MDMLKTGWNFFQNEVLGMAWLNRLIGNLINACGLDATSKIGGSIQFFVYDTIKIMVLLFLYREKPSEKHRDGKQVSSLRATTRIEGR